MKNLFYFSDAKKAAASYLTGLLPAGWYEAEQRGGHGDEPYVQIDYLGAEGLTPPSRNAYWSEDRYMTENEVIADNEYSRHEAFHCGG